MSKLYIVSKHTRNKYGNIGISNVVFEDIVYETIKELKNVHVVTAYNKRQISCVVENNVITVNAEINVNVGTNVNSISEKIQNMVSTNIKDFTGFENVKTNIIVKGFFIK